MFKKLYKEEQFNPKILGIFFNPFYFARKGLYKYILELIPNLSGRLLDVGCGSRPYENLCSVDEYIGLEIDDEGNRNNSLADVFYDGKIIPFDNNYFDSILSNQVFEHVFNPTDFLREMNRVTKKDGLLLLTVPFVWDEHEQPYDYARYSSFGLNHMLRGSGFEILEHRKSNNDISVIFQLLNTYIYKLVVTKNVYINFCLTFFLMSPINIIGLALSFVLPRNNDLYLDNIVLAKKIKDV